MKLLEKIKQVRLIKLFLMPRSACAKDVRVIPYPKGLDTKSDGASSAPTEINHKPSAYFTRPDIFELKSNENLTILSHYPTYQQTTEYSCGPAAALTVLWYYGINDVTEKELGAYTKGMPGLF